MATVVSTVAFATARNSAKGCRGRGFHIKAVNSDHNLALNRQCSRLGAHNTSVSRWNTDVGPESYPSHNQLSRFLSSAGRSRKRPRSWRGTAPKSGSIDIDGTKDVNSSSSNNTEESPKPITNMPAVNASHEEPSSPYPKGKPWRVLWPRPHGVPGASNTSIWNFRKRIPAPEQFRNAWSKYKETWEDGITGISTKPKGSGTENSDDADKSPISAKQELQNIGDNAAKNLKIVRKDAQDLLEQTKETTGIRTQDDLKALASEAMKIATECIREFMAGYRKGRDTEIDKMLHEYFQDEEEGEEKMGDKGSNEPFRDTPSGTPETVIMSTSGNEKTPATATTKPKKKRKPRRGIPRR